MAMNKKPKPLRPNPLKATLRGESASAKPVVKVKPKGVLRKSTVKNPTAPKGTGSGAASGSVRVLTKSESALKKGNPQSNKSDGKRPTPPGRNRSMTQAEKYKKGPYSQRLIEGSQYIRGMGYSPLTAADKKALTAKMKSKGVTPPKKKPEAPKTTGRGGRGGRGGGVGGIGAGGLFGSMFKR